MNNAVIVSAKRTAIGKAIKGTLKDTRPEYLLSEVIKAILDETKIEPYIIEDVSIGCAFPEAYQGMNLARTVIYRAGLPNSIPAVTVNRYCASSIQTIAQTAHRIIVGEIDVAIAGGVENMSLVPMPGYKFRPEPYVAQNFPHYYLNMGLTAENLVPIYNITRREVDEFAYLSHTRGAQAVLSGKFKEEIVPIKVKVRIEDEDGNSQLIEKIFEHDECPRPDTTLEGLLSLKPYFKVDGTVTAGNASQRSDGASAVLMMSERKAKELGLKPLARFITFQVVGVPAEIMGIAPAYAIPKSLRKANLKLDDIKLIELNEAFATQVIAVLRELPIPLEKLNVNGGAISLGHPLGATGAILTTKLIHELRKRGGGYGIVSACVGGGMGASMILEVYGS
ncbi:MAG: thiolase family protein [candidate division WOR-3 bacterium]|nr:thiolase family protein [candidate division WOR-3 bacterium]MCX7947006.1 thiolase family protein [candidate division WOR-3 bacterium]MDW8149953.1 thiolase family protein [candidate division WOR-3 bacterium]